MYGILGEDPSDTEMIKTLVRRIADDQSITIKTKGYSGCAEMLRKGATQLRLFHNLGCTRFIICYDADRDDPKVRYKKIIEDVIIPSKIEGEFCALVPIQELEAWILADLPAVSNVIKSWKPKEVFANPESRVDPKEELIKLSELTKHRPLYTHAVHNPQVAKYINLESLAKKCASSLPLFHIVRNGKGNHPHPSEAEQIQIRKDILATFQELAA